MLGTGNAITTQCYNTCFILRIAKSTLLVDAGGGNGILAQLEKARTEASLNFKGKVFVPDDLEVINLNN